MFDTVLFPTDGSDAADATVALACDIASSLGAELHVLTVADTTRDSVTLLEGEVVDTLAREGEQIVEETASAVADRGVSAVTEVRQGRPPETILEYAAQVGVDLIVLPTRGRGRLDRVLLGSTTNGVLRQAEVPVLTVSPDVDRPVAHPFEDVLVATDGSDPSEAALATGLELIDGYGARLHLLSVVNVASLGADVYSGAQIDSLERQARDAVEDAASRARERGVEAASQEVIEGSSVPRSIVSHAEDAGVDLLVVGTHGRTGLDRYLLGSVAEKLVRTAPVPVVTVRAPGDESRSTGS